jgi:hypothetical protein
MKTRLGCLTLPAFITVLLGLLIFGGVTLFRGGVLFTPGGLNAQAGDQLIGGVASHAALSTQCGSCHPAPWQSETMSNLCIACHTDVGQDPQNFHHALVNEKGNCRDCHTDHHGAAASLTKMDLRYFPHEKIGYSLKVHQKTANGSAFACFDCHGDKTSSFDQVTCSTCHSQIDTAYMEKHLAAFGQDCLTCHDGVDVYAQFDHAQVAFQLTGKHIIADCAGCHQGAKKPSDFQSTPSDCFSCHEKNDPHLGRMGQDCTSCHTPEDWHISIFDHSKLAFPLVGKHTTVSCQDCHLDGQLRETPQDCFACHGKQDPHQGQLGQDCAACHTPADWTQIFFDHSKAHFQLLGRHIAVACQECHKTSLFKGTPQDCFACHGDQDPHQGQLGQECVACHTPVDWKVVNFDHSKALFPLIGKHLTVVCRDCHQDNLFKTTPQDCNSCHSKDDPHQGELGQGCASCHTPADWKSVTFDHSQSRFSLTGKHAAVECRACHNDLLFKNTPTNCYNCHAKDDSHAGQLGTDCAACHTPAGWDRSTFDHNKASFRLTGKHIGVNCAACHAGGQYIGVPKNCYGCHAKDDRHGGQFGNDCAACHTTAGWGQVTFDHAKTSFPLSGKHAGVNCTACHVNGQYKGTPKNCYACHANDDKHNGQLGTDCGACHITSGWSQATFDHSKASFPLTGKHIGVKCAACHSGGQYSGTPKDCYSCHAAADAHNGQYGTNCGSCHTSNGWTPAHFDHSGFPLNGAHKGLPCASCHPGGHFQGTPSACSACHDDPAYHAGLFGNGCNECHNTSAWRPAEYNRGHTFPRNHGENNNNCHTCHPNRLSQYTCYACHKENEIRNKHLEEGIPDFENCMRCHPDGRKHENGGLAIHRSQYASLFNWLEKLWGTNWQGGVGAKSNN